MTMKNTRNLILALVNAAVVVLTIIFVGAGAQEDRLNAAGHALNPSTAAAAEGPTAQEFTLERRTDGDPMALGAVDAPVVMIEYSDYRCPFCGAYARKTQPEIIKKYVDSGKLRIEWRDFPVLGEASATAAVAARAAGEQGLFWEYNDAVYAAAPERGKADLSEPELMAFAKNVGVPDMATFAADLKSPHLLALVKADLDEGTALGLNSTPTFVINNQSIPGAQPLEIFSSVIDEALAQVK
ncbi:hypothetical protein AS189_17265 [Arthrobacter alpinus]|uniref:Thioredoxin domain-containing protein n=1 Tax=Arthrobacter alpinus TaxID=656366 RepID=A0A0S2M2T4_9MICC|nr:thioredoxin domain-containing protein [Arthrobacter alpinus]ALO67910.1 hypothetical protein AS189_17265 [Arthrobacter alpinus]